MTIVAFDPRLKAVVGSDAVLALFLSQVLYWHGPDKQGVPRLRVVDKDGGYWLAKSAKEWEDDLLLSRRQVDRCVSTLSRMGVIETKLMRFNGSPTTHIRFKFLQGRREVVTADRLLGQVALTNPGIPVCTKTPNPNGGSVQYTTETTAEISPSISSNVGASSTDKEQPLAKVQASSAAILAKFQAAKGVAIATDKATPQGMYEVWRQAVPRYIEGVSFVPPFTLKQMGMLKRLITLWGPQAPQILLRVIKGWVSYTKYCEQNLGAFKTPLQPALPFLVAYGAGAKNWADANPVQPVAPAPQKTGVIVKGIVDKQKPSAHNACATAQTPDTPADDNDAPITLAELMAYKPSKVPK